jgi:hypothetical protein
MNKNNILKFKINNNKKIIHEKNIISNDRNFIKNTCEKINKYNISNKIYISLTTIPPRLIDDDFDNIIRSLYHQKIPANKIIINICKKYRRKFNIDMDIFEKKKEYLSKKYSNLIFNFSDDYGPITKILGLYTNNLNINDDDIIISVDDDWNMDEYMTSYYYATYETYNCDCIFIDEKCILNQDKMIYLSNAYILYDNYDSFIYGWLSFSLKYKYIKKLYEFYIKYVGSDKNLWKHDDLIITLFYKKENLNACGINLYFNNCIKLQRKNIESNNALRLQLNEKNIREMLVLKMLLKFDIKLNNKKKYKTYDYLPVQTFMTDK